MWPLTTIDDDSCCSDDDDTTITPISSSQVVDVSSINHGVCLYQIG
jgi:hypothetical protein